MKKNNWFLKAKMGIFLLLFIVIFFNNTFLNAQTCTDNFQCGSHQYCEKATGDCFGIGICSDRPEPNRVGGPSVCGCNGQTYPNWSKAGAEGVNIAYIGECEITKPVANLAINPYWQNWYYPNWQNWYTPPNWQNSYTPNWQNWYTPYWQNWYNPYQWNWYDPWKNWNMYY